MDYRLAAGVPQQDAQRKRNPSVSGDSQPVMGGNGKCVDMLGNFTGTIKQDSDANTAQVLADVSTAFDAWLQAYRRQLEEVCQRANPRPVSSAEANS
jgi:hypothetical protein